jgi:hypothetical protein
VSNAVRPYRPSNGTEGEIFMERWCATCQRDADFQDGNDGAGCEIAARALAFDIGQPDYPAEWCETSEGPLCTAWEKRLPKPPPKPREDHGIVHDHRQQDLPL